MAGAEESWHWHPAHGGVNPTPGGEPQNTLLRHGQDPCARMSSAIVLVWSRGRFPISSQILNIFSTVWTTLGQEGAKRREVHLERVKVTDPAQPRILKVQVVQRAGVSSPWTLSQSARRPAQLDRTASFGANPTPWSPRSYTCISAGTPALRSAR